MTEYEYIVVGGGLAGLYTAHRASLYGKVALVTKEDIHESNSYYAQGGIAAVTDESDNPDEHYEDTIIAGRGLCEHDAVKILTEEAPIRIRELIDLGMEFDLDEEGALALGLEGGHHHKRILHAGGDSTGRMVTNFMIDRVMESPKIDIFTDHQAVSLLINEGGCYGVRTWNRSLNSEDVFVGRHIIMATGGSAALYSRTTNPRTTMGDGIAMCFQAGCKVRDMEFVQFHPTALYTQEADAFLISEAVRGEGAHLYNITGERFMLGEHELAELAPRDVVARRIFLEMRSLGDQFVYLSLAHLNPDDIRKRFPTISAKCSELGLDFSNRIPVAPAAHYTVGGVETDLHGKTSVKHLYVVGELASTGIMGANRLASNSLIECLVFGHRVVEDTVSNQGNHAPYGIITEPMPFPHDKTIYTSVKNSLAKLMMAHVGIIRNEPGLLETLERIKAIRQELGDVHTDLYKVFAEQLLIVAELITRGALERTESRGGHYREDFPHTDPKWAVHTVFRLQQSGN
ncbi:L-aspartate oxidase [Porphyromonas pogonae]|uniref:L-aspartate oxidase n=1 Tax=Porphyromonas pogonae TaxID=867595 RepID=UPI002E77E7BC|nr:L-aspartate oxidase [Porphyromonas pogonae]